MRVTPALIRHRIREEEAKLEVAKESERGEIERDIKGLERMLCEM